MLTSFFSTTKPINYVFTLVVFAIGFALSRYYSFNDADFLQYTSISIGIFLLFLFLFWLYNFIVKRNKMAYETSNVVLLLMLFLIAFPQTFSHWDLCLAALFLLLGLRRIYSLGSQMDTKKKIFDATLFVLVASLFYFWSIAFLVLVYIGILFYARTDYKNWMLPFVSMLVFVLLVVTYALYSNGIKAFLSAYYQSPQLVNFTSFSIHRIVPYVIFGLLLQIVMVTYTGFLRDTQQRFKSSYRLIIITAMIALTIVFVLAPVHDGRELLFLGFPFVVMFSRLLESQANFWVREIMLALLLALPLIQLLF
ncbi:MAG: DUF6427 family protein [Leeuwenhoekiella sp.]